MYLVQSIDSGATVTSDITDVYNYHYDTKVVEISKAYIDNYTGMTFEEKDIVDTLRALEFKVDGNKDNYVVTVPSFRATKDIQGRPDLVEEIARIYGYDNIEPKSCNMEVLPVDLKKSIDAEYNIKYTLATKYNLSEVHTYLWYDYETNKELNIKPISHLKIVNSLQKDNDELRSTLIPSQLKVVMDNKADYSSFGVFEIGSAVIGLDKDNLSIEHKKLCVTLYDKVDNVDRLLDLKEMLEYVCREIVQIPVTFVPGTPNVDYMSPANYYNIV
jgi:phenylalanyl-tRNA synthetase beta chain